MSNEEAELCEQRNYFTLFTKANMIALIQEI